MGHQMPPDDDPIIRSIRDAGIRPLRPARFGQPRLGGRRPTAVILGVVLFFVLFMLVPTIAMRLTDWLWFREIGFERVFLTKIVAQWTLGIAVGAIVFAFLYGNARVALARSTIDRGLGLVAFLGTLFVSVLFALGLATQWTTALQLIYRTPFGVADPVFGRDVGYYVFALPAIETALGVALGCIIVGLFFVALPIYLAGNAIFVARGRMTVTPPAQKHVAILGALLLLVMALQLHFVDVPGLLFGDHLALSGANYVDLHVRLFALHTLSVAALVAAAYIVRGAWREWLVPASVRAIIGYIAVSLAVWAIPAAYQRLVVQPNELARETPQIVHHIKATRQAWGIDSVEFREVGVEAHLTPQIIASNRATIDNVRLWDREPLLQTFGQIQSIRTYYDFVAVDDDRYHINGQLRQVMLSARELNTDALPTKGFINEHLTYTHGMGVTLGPSNEVTGEGLPVLFIKDLPPVSSIDVRVTRPQIYYGEQSNDFVLAPSREREFDYPAGEGDAAAYSSYDGRGGVSAGSFLRRLLFAVRFGSLNILLSRDLTDRTRILYYRDVRERAERALPFLLFDRDPYMVIAKDGRLQWILDAYTVSDRYPYAEAVAGGINYMRNSVKVVIDAYDGTVSAYLTAPSDPMIRTFARIYPKLFQPIANMPADLRAHIRYPEDLFRVQTTLYATYHMANPETFYHREDQWQVPGTRPTTAAPTTDGPQGDSFLRHMVMRLPGQTEPEYTLMRPFTPRQKDNLAAWMVARNDGAHYGQLAVYRFPRQSLVFGPSQIVNRINQDTEVSRQITLWDQRGSEVLRGELLVLPIEGALIYVQPLYLRAQGGRIPELKRVVVAQEGRVAMAETLDAALATLIGSPRAISPTLAADSTTAPPVAATEGNATTQSLTASAIDHYDRARAAQRSDNWAAYGDEMRKLGDVLRQLQQARERRP
jgi:uncharacterized membrane protein (UPF0182 family)